MLALSALDAKNALSWLVSLSEIILLFANTFRFAYLPITATVQEVPELLAGREIVWDYAEVFPKMVSYILVGCCYWPDMQLIQGDFNVRN